MLNDTILIRKFTKCKQVARDADRAAVQRLIFETLYANLFLFNYKRPESTYHGLLKSVLGKLITLIQKKKLENNENITVVPVKCLEPNLWRLVNEWQV